MSEKNPAGDRYPRTVQAGGVDFELRLMNAADQQAVLEFAQSMPRHDLLFLRRDISQAKVLAAWVSELALGNITSLLALVDGKIAACSAVTSDPHSFSPHVGELRVLLHPEYREQGIGRTLLQENFLIALSSGLSKLTAQMTGDQQSALALFEELDFRVEALFRDHVKDADGELHDLLVVSHDVERVQSKMALYGMTEAFDV